MCKAGSNAFDTDGDAMTFSGTELEFDHFPGAEHTGCQPKVVVLVPVLILGGPQHSSTWHGELQNQLCNSG